MPACIWPQEYELKFVRDELGPLLEKQGLATKIWILDHNYNLWGRAVAELDDPVLRKYGDAIRPRRTPSRSRSGPRPRR